MREKEEEWQRGRKHDRKGGARTNGKGVRKSRGRRYGGPTHPGPSSPSDSVFTRSPDLRHQPAHAPIAGSLVIAASSRAQKQQDARGAPDQGAGPQMGDVERRVRDQCQSLEMTSILARTPVRRCCRAYRYAVYVPHDCDSGGARTDESARVHKRTPSIACAAPEARSPARGGRNEGEARKGEGGRMRVVGIRQRAEGKTRRRGRKRERGREGSERRGEGGGREQGVGPGKRTHKAEGTWRWKVEARVGDGAMEEGVGVDGRYERTKAKDKSNAPRSRARISFSAVQLNTLRPRPSPAPSSTGVAPARTHARQ
ncbi:hypothetical protein DFH09DRAFT_1106208 [Mycena vulgaris]|nr:hypothetical protein DFH09DRAFT_1106208 [Mycena vulgaris]